MLTILDVSNWQGVVNWRRVRGAGIELAFVKATEGSGYVDPRLEMNRRQAADAGVRIGCYAFVQPTSSTPERQALWFCDHVQELRRRELRPVQDLETGPPSMAEDFARKFSRTVTRRLGVTPLIYSYAAYLEAMHLDRTIGGGLWLASYGRNDGRDYGAAVPKPWRGWVAHQFTSKGHAPGIAGNVDVSHAPRLRPLLAHPIAGLI